MATTSAIRVLLFGSLRDRLGHSEIALTGPASTVAEVWAAVVAQHAVSDAERQAIRCARNLVYCEWSAPVAPGDEVAFMPPVCGGSADDGLTVALSAEAIMVDELLARAGQPADGAVACFVGRVRNQSGGEVVHALDYEAYAPMALALMRRIAADARTRHELSTIVLVHRVGQLAVGDVAVVVVTSSPHRAAALDACREVIEAVKAEVPIWKREHTATGTHWVDARCLDVAGV
jgi:molybdopterin synthase catalytic subunit